MKKIFTIVAAIALFIACDESKETIDSLSFPSDAFVSFDTTTISVLESEAATINVVMNLSNSAAAATAETNVGFTISSDNAVEGVHYTLVEPKTSFNLAPGVFQDALKFKSIDNTDEDGDKVITITLIDAPVTLGFPGPDGLGKTITLTLQDDDCAVSLEGLGAATWSGEDSVPSGEAGPNASVITTSFDGTNLLMEGLSYAWLTDADYWNEVVVLSNPVIVTVDLETGAIDIALQPLCTATWLGDVQPLYEISATGTYTACSETMVLDYTLYQAGAVRRQYSETITKN
jgi:hypothetical protein